jgi:hypothetical protein
MCWNPSFQDLPDATIWERNRATCYAAGRVFLACLLPVRLVLFLELLAPFRAARQTSWAQEALRYLFPREWLWEQHGQYALSAGGHMGLGEDRHDPICYP